MKLSQRLNRLWGNKAGINILRKSYLTTKYGNMINEQDNMKKDFAKMGSSENQSRIYVLRT